MAARRRALVLLLVIASAGCTAAGHVSESDRDSDHRLVRVIDEEHGRFRLVVEAIGSPPLLLRKGVIRICGFELRVTCSQAGPIYAECHGESEADVLIDHTDFGRGILRITSLTSDPRQQDGIDVPFVRTCVTLRRDGEPQIAHDVLLPPGEADDAMVEKWIDEILAQNAVAWSGDEERRRIGEVIERDFGHLRNAAISRPDAILTRLRLLPRIAVDCECQHMKGAWLKEVALLQSIQQEQSKAGLPADASR